MIKGLTAVVILAFVLGCAGPATRSAPRPAQQAALARSIPVAPGSDAYPVIVHIVRHDRIITVKSGPDGLLYSMRGEKDKVLLADATEAQFEQASPRLYREIQRYMAVHADTSSAIHATSARD